MKTIFRAAFGACVLAGATIAMAHAANDHSRTYASGGQTTAAEYVLPGTLEAAPDASPVLQLGHVGVYVWTPGEPPYDANANRNFAADPLWEAAGR